MNRDLDGTERQVGARKRLVEPGPGDRGRGGHARPRDPEDQ